MFDFKKLRTDVEIPRVRVDLLLGSKLQDTYIAIDGKPGPYKSILLFQEYGRTILLLERCWNTPGEITQDLVDNPIIDLIEASPLIIATSKEGLEWHHNEGSK